MPPDHSKKTRFNYSKESLKEAMAAISAGMSLARASVEYKIPRSTLRNKKKSKNIDKKPGPATILTADEEETLSQWILECSNIGMPVGKQQLLNSVPLLLKGANRTTSFSKGHHWYKNFLGRNGKIIDRISDNLAIARAPVTENGLRNWFANVGGYLKAKRLLNIDSSRIFSSENVLIVNPESTRSSDDCLAVQMIGNAAGQLTNLMMVFTQDRLSTKVHETALPKGWTIKESESGHVTAENFYEFVKDCFYPWLVANKVAFPVVLFVNGRVSHLTYSLTEFCKKHKIELIALHPNSANLIHPLEALFSPLKDIWKQNVDSYCKANQTVHIERQNIVPLLKTTLDKMNIFEILKKGFVNCGLHPMSVESVNFRKIPDRPGDKVQKERVEFSSYVCKTETYEPLEEQEQEETSTLSRAQFLQMFEQNLDPSVLQAFKDSQKSRVWEGRIQDTSLFYFWKNAVHRAFNSSGSDNDNSGHQQNLMDNNPEFNDIEFHNVNEFLEIQSREDLIVPDDPIRIFDRDNR